MALKNYVFRENWVGSEVAATFWPQKAPQKWNSLNRITLERQLYSQLLWLEMTLLGKKTSHKIGKHL